MVLGESIAPVAAGLVIGLSAALALGRLLASLLYQVTPADPLVLASAAIATAFAALVACGMPVLRALRVDPIAALRCD
jgi:predicted lysophospholipase L1 biosynthesis ABC-type transport system permease subunit